MVHKIGLIGFGTVGRGIAEILRDKKKYLKEKYNFEYQIVAVADFAFGNVYNADGLNMDLLLKQAENKEKFTGDLVSLSTLELIANSNVTTWCELTYTDLQTGGPAVEHVRTALKAGKNIVTSNKGPAALYYDEMTALAKANNVRFLIEGTVMAGTPTLNLADGPLAGNTITKAYGILNGTTNYMLSEMEKGMAYEEVLKIAQKLGYAEADPTGDVEGYDARAKVCILANVVMGAGIKITDVKVDGITKITPADIEKAKRENKRWKLIGSVELLEDGSVDAYVKPMMVDLSHPLAGIMGATNALTFSTDLVNDITIVGPGAGKIETGFSILTDILRIHKGY
jgi:homoserine dehydrogenase